MMRGLQLFLAGTLTVLVIGCSSGAATNPQQTATPPASSAATHAQPSLVAVTAESAPEARVVLHTDGEPGYSGYSPQPDVFVVDLPGTAKSTAAAIPTNLPDYVASVSADEAVEMGSPLTRVTFRFTQPVVARAEGNGDEIAVTFRPTSVASSPVTIEEVPVVAAAAPAPDTATMKISSAEPAMPPTVAPSSSTLLKSGRKATRLESVTTTGSGQTLAITLHTNGAVTYKAFKLSNPLRLVIDLTGVNNAVAAKTRDLGDPYVKRIRISQFESGAHPVTRVVLDLDEMVDYDIATTDDALIFAMKDAPESTQTASAPSTTVTTVASVDQKKDNPFTEAPAEPARAGGAPEIEPIAASHVINSANQPKPVQIAQASTRRRQTAPSTTTTTTTEDVFNQPGTTQELTGNLPGATRTLSAGERVYTGEPIDLSLKDADIKDVLRTFAQLTGLNIAVDPQVSGTVTVQFENVPWDQALDLILKQNGLTYVQQGNVIRIGTIDRLRLEQEQTRKLNEEARLSVPTQTVIKHLSYAKAGDVAALLGAVASPRGKLIVDSRTNQVIITEVPEYLSTMLNLIDTVDIPTPQVVIEARIVETTKNFTQRLGIDWGFNGTLDPALGTGTGLVFPNRVDFTGGRFSFPAGNPVISATLSNVLGTFDLDFILSAAEAEGLVKIISAPKVTTQDNQAAEIQSGVQIPIQTRVNFTTTVNYIDATLRLSVTPQVTQSDTVIMEISVQKTEPAIALQVAGSTNVPLTTRRAMTKLMVRDGATTVIGGIYQASDNRGQSRVPFIHQIPIIGNLFKNNTIDSRHDELLIFITPRIVRNS